MQNPYIQTLQAGASVANQAYGQASQSIASVANIFNSSASLAMKMSALLEQEEARKQQQALQIADYMHRVQQDEFMNKYRTRVQDFNEENANRTFDFNNKKFNFNKQMSENKLKLQQDNFDFAKKQWTEQKELTKEKINALRDKAKADLLKQQLEAKNKDFKNTLEYIKAIPQTVKEVLPNGQIVERINPEYEKALQSFKEKFGIDLQQEPQQATPTLGSTNSKQINTTSNSFMQATNSLLNNKYTELQPQPVSQLTIHQQVSQFVTDADGRQQPNPYAINKNGTIPYNLSEPTAAQSNNPTTLGSVTNTQTNEQRNNKYVLSNLDIQQIEHANLQNASPSFIEPMQRKVDYTLGSILNSNMSVEDKYNAINSLMKNKNMDYFIKHSQYYDDIISFKKQNNQFTTKITDSLNNVKNVKNSLNTLSVDNLTGEGLFMHTIKSLLGMDNMSKAQREQVGSIINQNPTLAIPLSVGMYMANNETGSLDFVYDKAIVPIKKLFNKATPLDTASIASNTLLDKKIIGANRFVPLSDNIISEAKDGNPYAKSSLEAYNFGLPKGKTYQDVLNLKTCAEYGNQKCLNELKQLDNQIYNKFSIRLNQITNTFLKEKGFDIDANINAKKLTNKVITWLGNDKVAKRLGFKNGKDAITQYLYMSYFISDKILTDANENYNSVNE